METITFELWHFMLLSTFLATMASAWIAAKLFKTAEDCKAIFGLLTLVAVFLPCLLAWFVLFQRLISNVLKTM